MSPKRKDIPGLSTAEECKQARDKYPTLGHIGRAFGVSEQTVARRMAFFDVDYDHTRARTDTRERRWFSLPDPRTFESLTIARERDEIRANTWPQDKPARIGIISDTHEPETCWPLLEYTLKRFGKVDGIVHAGDICRWEPVSPYHNATSEDWFEALDGGVRIFNRLAEAAPWLAVVRGNHDARLEKVLRRAMREHPKLADWLVAQTDLMRYLKQESHGTIYAHRGWWLRFGNDLVVCHPDEFSGVPLRSATNMRDWFEWRREKFVDPAVLVMGHTHRWSQGRYHNCRVIELGCMCWDSDWEQGPKLSSGKKDRWHRGAVALTLLPDGSVDIPSIEVMDLTPVFDSYPGARMEERWTKPPAKLLKE